MADNDGKTQNEEANEQLTKRANQEVELPVPRHVFDNTVRRLKEEFMVQHKAHMMRLHGFCEWLRDGDFEWKLDQREERPCFVLALDPKEHGIMVAGCLGRDAVLLEGIDREFLVEVAWI